MTTTAVDGGDSRLVERAAAGSSAAERALYERFAPSLRAYCACAADGDRSRADDLVQETLIRAFKGLSHLRDRERLRSWLFAIAANVCRDAGAATARARRLEQALALEVEPHEDDDKLVREHRIRKVAELLDEVEDPKVRAIVQLRYREPEHTTRQIAEKLGIPHGTVTVTLVRFRARIKGELVRMLMEDTP